MLFIILACAEPKQTVLNSPEIRITSEDSYTGDELVVEILSDPDVEEGDLSYQYEWYINNELQPDLNTEKVDGGLVLGHQEWKVVVEATLDFDETTLSSQAQAEIIILNSLPSVDLEDWSIFRSDEDVIIGYTSSDVDGDELTAQLVWSESQGAEYIGTFLPASQTLRGEMWSVEITVDDGYESIQQVSEIVEIGNSLPTIDVVDLPTEGSRKEDIVAVVSGSDLDNDDLTAEFSWYVDDILVKEGSQPLELSECSEGLNDCCLEAEVLSNACAGVLEKEQVFRDAVVRMEVSLFDGFESSSIEVRELSVINSTPSLLDVSIAPESLYADGTAVCSTSGYIDLDSDPDESMYTWKYNGQEIAQGESIVLSDYGLVHGDVLSCVVVPYDGFEEGESVFADIEVSNTPAIVTEVLLGPVGVTEDDVLTCSNTGYTDLDGETASISYGWMIDGVDIGIGSDTLTGDSFDKDQSVSCYATADDGTEVGEATQSTESVLIENDVPFIAGISVTPSAVTRASTLTCSYIGYSDSDPADSDQSIVEWFSGTTKVGDGPVFDVGASTLSRGEYISCSVTPFDGFEEGYAFTKTLVIYNALPEVSNLQLSPNPVYTNDTISVLADIEDPDDDAYTIDYAWFVDGVELSNITTSTLDGEIFFNKGQEVYAQIRITDPFGTLVEDTESIIVSNRPPPAPEVSIIPQNIYVDDDILCSVIGQENDEDGDPITYLVEWEQNGTTFSNTSTSVLTGDTIVASNTSFQDTWTCHVSSVDDDLDQSVSSVDITICPLGQSEECAASSCAEIHQQEYSDFDRDGNPNDGLYWIDPQETGAYEAYCDMSHDDGGWTMLLSADGESNYWGNNSPNWYMNPIDFGSLDATNSAHAMYFAPSTPAQENLHLAPYEHVATDEIRLCYENLNRCYTFVHNQGIALNTFFTDGVSHVEYAFNVRDIPDVGSSEIELTDFVNGLGREPYGGICEWLGINNIESGSAIGFIGDDGEACVGSTTGHFDQVALGLGLQSCADGDGCSNGWDTGNLAGQQRNLRVVGTVVLNKFWVFGR